MFGFFRGGWGGWGEPGGPCMGWGMGPGFFGGWGAPGLWGIRGGWGFGSGMFVVDPLAVGSYLIYPYSPLADLLTIPFLAAAAVAVGALVLAMLKMLGTALLVPLICALLGTCLMIALPNAITWITRMLILQPFLSYAWCSICWALWSVGELEELDGVALLGWILFALFGLAITLVIREESFGLGFLNLFSGLFLWWSGILGAGSYWRGELMVRYWFRIFGVIIAIALIVNLILILRQRTQAAADTSAAAGPKETKAPAVSGLADVLTGLGLGTLAMLVVFFLSRLFIDTLIANILLLAGAVLAFGGAAWLYTSPKRARGGFLFLLVPLLFGIACWYAGRVNLYLEAAPLNAAYTVWDFLTADLFLPLAEAAQGLGEALADVTAALLHLILSLILLIFDSRAPWFSLPAEACAMTAIPMAVVAQEAALRLRAKETGGAEAS